MTKNRRCESLSNKSLTRKIFGDNDLQNPGISLIKRNGRLFIIDVGVAGHHQDLLGNSIERALQAPLDNLLDDYYL